MAISSPQVREQSRQDPMNMITAGMQLGQMMQMQKQQRAYGARSILDSLEKYAEGIGGDFAGMMKDPDMQKSVALLYQDLGMSSAGANEMAKAMGNGILKPKGAMEIEAVVDAYARRGEQVPPDVYKQYADYSTGETPVTTHQQQQQTTVPGGEITGSTYKWQEPVQPVKEKENGVEMGGPEVTPSSTPKPTTEVTPSPTPLPTTEVTPSPTPPGMPSAVKAVLDVSTPVQTVEQKKQVKSGKWVVADKNTVVGEVTDGVFRPNKDFKWTNESQMLNGLAKQTWGDQAGDMEAFKNMLYNSAKEAGYKGSMDQFFKYQKPYGRASSHGARMPQWYDWAVKNGLQIKQPAETPVADLAKYSGATPSRVTGIKKTGEQVSYMIEKLDGTISRDISKAQPGDIVTKYTPKQRPEAAGGGYAKEEKSIFGYGTYKDFKKDEEFMRRHIGHYADFLYGNEKEWLRNMQNHRRVYENLGGDRIMEVLAPNQTQMQQAELAAAMDRAVLNAGVEADRIKTQKELGYAELELKRQLGQRGLDLEEYRNHLQALLGNEELVLKKAMAELEYGQKTDDTAWKLYETGYKYLEMTRKKYGDQVFKTDLGKLYQQDFIFTTGYNMLLQASAIRNGIDPDLVLKYAEFKATRDPYWWENVQNLFKQEGQKKAGGGEMPTFGITKPYTQEEQKQKETVGEFEKREEAAGETLQSWGIE